MKRKSQAHMYYDAEKMAGEVNRTFLELVNHPTNPLTREDLIANIQRRPALWSRFAGWVDKLPAREG
jgi:hypothetical protein